MLARITDLAPDAAADHSGTLLRFADRTQVHNVRGRLAELGYESSEVRGGEYRSALVAEWYSPRDLSREEANALAAQIVPAFIAAHPVHAALATPLRERVEASLLQCFIANSIVLAASSLPISCGDPVAAAVSDLIGDGASLVLARFVDGWLSA